MSSSRAAYPPIARTVISNADALQTFAERRVRGVPEDVVRGLFAWDRGERPVDLLFEVPSARRLLASTG